MSVYDVELFEPIGTVVTADSLEPTVDALEPTADGGLLEGASDRSDALVGAHFISAEIDEPVATPVTVDTTAYSADNTTWPTADGGLLEGATETLDAEVIAIGISADVVETASAADQLDAEVIPAEVVIPGGGVRPRKPFPVEGVGYGVLPQLEGEGYGTVGVAGAGDGEVELDDEELVLALLMALDEAA